MSIKFTGGITLRTNTDSDWPGAGNTAFSLALFLRYDGDTASARDYVASSDNAMFTMGIPGAWPDGNLRLAATIENFQGIEVANSPDAALSPGTTYFLALTWATGAQYLSINGFRTLIGARTDAVASSGQGLVLGSITGASTKVFSVRDLAHWTGYTLSPADEAALRDGTATPATLATPATAWYPLSGTQGQAVQVGDPGLANSFGGGKLPAFNALAGTGTAVYADAMPFVPAARAEAAVISSGEGIYVVCKSLATGQWTPETLYVSEPTIRINGGAPVQLHADASVNPLRNVLYRGMFYPLPVGTAIGAGDVVTISAPTGWVNTAAGIAAGMVDQAVSNCVGRSFFGTDTMSRTMRAGVNIDLLGFGAGAVNPVMKNYRQRSNNARNVSGFVAQPYVRPTQLSGPSGSVVPVWMPDNNFLDGTGTPVPAGLCAVRWDDTGPDRAGHPTRLAIASDDGTVTEHPEYANPGSGGLGQVRVFDCQPVAPRTQMQIRLVIEYPNANAAAPLYTPSFDNDGLYLPGEFTPGSPTVIPAPTIEPSEVLKANLAGGGVHRWMNPTEQWDTTAACEPEHLSLASDWTYQSPRTAWRVGWSQLRPWSPAASPYVYHHLYGDEYAATLGQALDAPASGTIQTIAIADAMAAPAAATGPVLVSQTLVNGSELIRVIAVTPTTGTAADVTVERGAMGTTPQARAAGTITVRYRVPMPSLTSWQADRGVALTEAVASAPHNLRSFQVAGTSWVSGHEWPATTFTDGFAWNWGNSGNPAWITGPNTIVWVLGGGYDNNSVRLPQPGDDANGIGPNVTSAGTQTLDPTYHYTDIAIPEVCDAPFEVQARISGSFADNNGWVNIPMAASDSYVRAVAKIYRQDWPTGRRLYLEYQNEPWNQLTYVHGGMFIAADRMLTGSAGSPPLVWLARRTGQIRKIFRDEFAIDGRQGEIHALVNMPIGFWGSVAGMMNQARNENLPIDGVCVHTYWGLPYEAADWQRYVATRSAAFVCDMISFHLQCCTAPILDTQDVDIVVPNFTMGISPASYGRNFRAALDSWTAANAAWVAANVAGGRLVLTSYEGGPDTFAYPKFDVNSNLGYDTLQDAGGIDAAATTIHVLYPGRYYVGQHLLLTPQADDGTVQRWAVGPNSEYVKITAIDLGTGALAVLRGQGVTTAKSHLHGARLRNLYVELARDIVYHPNFWIANQEAYACMQAVGYEDYAQFSYGRPFVQGFIAWGMTEAIGQPAGRGDGTGGGKDNRLCTAAPGPHQKALTTNHVANTDNVRFRSMLDWNATVGTAPATGTAPSVARSPARARRGRSRAGISR